MRKTRVNHEIRLSPIKVIDQNDKMLGEMPTERAKALAEQAGLDLVEINPDVRPPLCKITDYGKYKYELSKKTNKGQKAAEMKEVRLGRSMKIDDHDVSIRVAQARKFLMEGHKVQLVAQFRGREMAHKNIGIERLKRIVEELSDIAKVEVPMRSAGRRMNMILSPERQKVEAIKRRQEAERQKLEAANQQAAPDQAQAEDVSAPVVPDKPAEQIDAPTPETDNKKNHPAKKKDDGKSDLERMLEEVNTI